MEREAFLYVKAKLLNSSITNRKNFGSGKVYFNLTGAYMNDPLCPRSTGLNGEWYIADLQVRVMTLKVAQPPLIGT